MTSTRRSRRHTGTVVAILAGVIGLVITAGLLLTSGTLTAPANTTPPTGAVTDMRGRPVTPETAPDPEQHAAADTGTVVSVPAVGLRVPLGALSAVHGQITPPGFTSLYWVRNTGIDWTTPTQGTVFLVTHSLRGGGTAPGNSLYNTTTGTSRLHPGDTITIGDTSWHVTTTTTTPKDRLAADSSIWANTPNRLVLITCLETPDGKLSTSNFIVQATHTP